MRFRPLLLLVTAALLMAATLPALAVSDGNYDPSKQGCRGSADNSNKSKRTDQHCYSATLRLSGVKHIYVMVGVPQTPECTTANAVEICLDFTGTAKCARFDASDFTALPDRLGTPVDPQKGELHSYFGADDNLDSGEHDSSSQVNNGASDGGALQTNLTPFSAADRVAHLLAGDKGYVLTDPLPGADDGAGACADGLCISAQTIRRVA